MLNPALEHAARVATHDHLVCLINDAAGTDQKTGSPGHTAGGTQRRARGR